MIAFTWSSGATTGGKAILDYRVSYDQGADDWIVLDSTITVKRYQTSVSLIAGETYKFTVEARNDVGYSSPSAPISIVAASPPQAPAAPVTSINGDTVNVIWVAPYNGGSKITSYKIEIQQSDGLYSQDLVNCDGK